MKPGDVFWCVRDGRVVPATVVTVREEQLVRVRFPEGTAAGSVLMQLPYFWTREEAYARACLDAMRILSKKLMAGGQAPRPHSAGPINYRAVAREQLAVADTITHAAVCLAQLLADAEAPAPPAPSVEAPVSEAKSKVKSAPEPEIAPEPELEPEPKSVSVTARARAQRRPMAPASSRLR